MRTADSGIADVVIVAVVVGAVVVDGADLVADVIVKGGMSARVEGDIYMGGGLGVCNVKCNVRKVIRNEKT